MSATDISKLVVLWVIGIASVSGLQATKGSTDQLADDADAVVVAEVQSGQQTGRSLAFVLSINRSVKGNLVAGGTVDVSANGVSANLSISRQLAGQYGLWFLKKTGNHWTFLPMIQSGGALETSGYIPLVKTTTPAAVHTSLSPATTGDLMAVEIVAALQSYSDPRQIYNLALALFRIEESAVLPDIYSTLRANPDPQLKFVGLTGLLGGGDEISALSELAANVDLIPKLRVSSLLETSIAGIRNADPAAIPFLGVIASSSNLDLQRCAGMALENKQYYERKVALRPGTDPLQDATNRQILPEQAPTWLGQ